MIWYRQNTLHGINSRLYMAEKNSVNRKKQQKKLQNETDWREKNEQNISELWAASSRLRGCWGNAGGWIHSLSWWRWVSQLHTNVKPHQIVCFKYIQFIVLQLCLNTDIKQQRGTKIPYIINMGNGSGWWPSGFVSGKNSRCWTWWSETWPGFSNLSTGLESWPRKNLETRRNYKRKFI